MNEDLRSALKVAESILSLLHYRGLVDSENNRQDVEHALRVVRDALRLV